MAHYPTELLEIARFLATSHERREAIGRATAATLGDGWSPADLVGEKRLCSLRYAPLDLVFVVVPGGRFQMGFREDDREAASRCVDIADPFVQSFLEQCEKDARPVHQVTVRPHLFAQKLLRVPQVAIIDPKHGTDEVSRTDAGRLAAAAGFRLPAEAEYEWIAREGGGLHFTCDAPGKFHGTPLMASELANGFGVEDLLYPQWMEDDPHDSYQGAPETSQPWKDAYTQAASEIERRQGTDGVRRGALECNIERPIDLLYCLASLRTGGDLITLRLCRDLA